MMNKKNKNGVLLHLFVNLLVHLRRKVVNLHLMLEDLLDPK